MLTLDVLIRRIQERFANTGYGNEVAVREAVVLPVLAALNWDIWNPDAVKREFTLGTRRVDYALSAESRRPSIFVEVKAPDQTLGSDRQLFEYAFHEGIPMAVLTDGREWNFYLPGEQGSYDDRRFYRLDLVDREIQESEDRLRRYLEFNRVKDGSAFHDAREDYRKAAKHRLAAEAIPKAWHEIISEPDELLIDLIVERAETLSGFRPDAEDVENFLLAIQKSESPRGALRPSQPRPMTPPQQRINTTPRLAGQRQIEYEIFGDKREAKNAKEAMIEILQTLGARQPDFWERLAQRARARKRNHLARRQDEVYPGRPDLAENAFEISPGWWIGLNIANREKDRIVRAACECANVRFGQDLKIDFVHS